MLFVLAIAIMLNFKPKWVPVTHVNYGASEGYAPLGPHQGTALKPLGSLQCPPNPQLLFMIPTASWSPSAANLFHAFSFLNLDRSDVCLTSGKDVNRVSVEHVIQITMEHITC